MNVADADGEAGNPRVEMRRDGEPAVVQLHNGTVVVDDILFVGSNRIVVRGKLNRLYSRPNVITVIDTETNEIIDTVWGMDVAFSPDSKSVAYQFLTPMSGPSQVVLWPALIAYDLTAPPNLNMVPGADGDFRLRGIPIYPEQHRNTHRYVIPLGQQEGEMSGGRPRLGFVSPIAWSPDSKHLAVVDHDGQEDRLVVIDVSRGLQDPSVMLVPVAREVFLPPRLANALPAEYADSFVLFQDLRFSDAGDSVFLKAWPFGPYSDETLTLAIPATSP